MIFNSHYNPNMKNQNLDLKEFDSINLNSWIVGTASCKQYIAAGCLDDSLHVWKTNVQQFQKEVYLHFQGISGVTDIKFNSKSTHVACLSIDSSIKIWDLVTKPANTFEAPNTIEVPMFGAWRIIFAQNHLIVCGDLGRISFYDVVSREIVKKMDVGDHFMTAINKSQNEKRILFGNANGDVYLLKTQLKDEPNLFKMHYKTIRSVTFTKDQEKLLTASDDASLALFDITKSKTVSCFQGHEEKVTCVKNHFQNDNYFYSCSTDKKIKIWDCRAKKDVFSTTTTQGLWSLEPLEKFLLVGGQMGVLRFWN